MFPWGVLDLLPKDHSWENTWFDKIGVCWLVKLIGYYNAGVPCICRKVSPSSVTSNDYGIFYEKQQVSDGMPLKNKFKNKINIIYFLKITFKDTALQFGRLRRLYGSTELDW